MDAADMNRISRISRIGGYILAALILGGSVAVAVLLISMRPEPARRAPPSRIPFVTTAPAVAGSGALTVSGAGTVRARAEVDVAAGVSGRVVEVDPAFQSGGRVRAGQVLFRIEDADYRHRVERARAVVAVQQVELLKVEAEAAVAREQYERFQDGNAAGEAGSPLARWEPQLEAARAALDRDRTALAEAELLLARTQVRAPFDAVVRSEAVAVGQYVLQGAGVGHIHPSDAVEVAVPLSDDDAALLPDLWRLGDDRRVPARVLADFGTGRFSWDGTLDRVEAARDESTRAIEVVVRVPNPFPAASPPLLVGQFVDVEIEGAAPEPYFRIRRLALRPGNEVWAVRDDDTLAVVPVRVLQRVEDAALVVGDLRDGQQVVVSGIPFATDGMRVRAGAAPDP